MRIDETAQVKDDLYDAVRPMLAVSNGDLPLMSTPRGRTRVLSERSLPRRSAPRHRKRYPGEGARAQSRFGSPVR
jgi:hypothetical protein